MAKDLQGFLNALFASEGGGNLSIINKFGYVGKYQFGEDALMDLGYFNHDGQKHEKDGKFFQDWDGTWTGKDGATSLQVFRNSEAIQDKAGQAWVRRLCSMGRKYGAHAYIGQTIGGVLVTESGIIAAAHLKGYGTVTPKDGKYKTPAVMAFLKTGGAINATDAFGTSVGKYMAKFAGYALGCCEPVEVQQPWSYPFPPQGKTTALDGAAYIGLPALQGALSKADDGFFPIGASGLWHGGIHFDAGTGTVLNQTDGVRCIKDGEIVAYMVNRKYPEITFPKVQRSAAYSSGFTLVRHRIELPPNAESLFKAEAEKNAPKTCTPDNPSGGVAAAGAAGATTGAAAAAAPSTAKKEPAKADAPKPRDPGMQMVFYSLYMHLLDFQGYEENPKRARPAYWDASNEFVVGERAKDKQEVPPPPVQAAAEAPAEVEEVGCDCGHSISSEANELLGFFPPETKEWDNVTSEELVHE
jgi:hypothetical protein